MRRLRYYARRMVDRAERVKALESSLVERMFEILSSIKVIKSFARERHELGRFSDAGDDTMRARLRLTWQESLFSVVVSAITLSGTALVARRRRPARAATARSPSASLLVVIAYLAAVYNPLSSIAHTTGSLQQAVVSARRVREILALTPEPFDAPGRPRRRRHRRRHPLRARQLRLRRPHRSCTTSASTPVPASWSRSSGSPAPARPRWPA